MATSKVDLYASTRTIVTLEIDLSDAHVDPMNEVEIQFRTPDGRFHAKRVPTSWFVPTNY